MNVTLPPHQIILLRALIVLVRVPGLPDLQEPLDLQINLLKDAGIFVFQTHAKATSFCGELLKQARG